MWHSGENEECSNSFFGNLPISSPKCPSEDPLTFHQCTYQSCCWALSQELYFEPKAQTGTQTSVPPSFSRSTFSSSGSTNGDFSSPNEPNSLGKTDSWLRSKDKEESPLTLVWSVLPLHMVYIYAAHMLWVKNGHKFLTHLSLGGRICFHSSRFWVALRLLWPLRYSRIGAIPSLSPVFKRLTDSSFSFQSPKQGTV